MSLLFEVIRTSYRPWLLTSIMDNRQLDIQCTPHLFKIVKTFEHRYAIEIDPSGICRATLLSAKFIQEHLFPHTRSAQCHGNGALRSSKEVMAGRGLQGIAYPIAKSRPNSLAEMFASPFHYCTLRKRVIVTDETMDAMST
jgi:hypothetical protein